MKDKKIIENLAGESMEDMGLTEHFNDDDEAVKHCTSCGDEIPNESRYGDCDNCLGERFGIDQY